MKKPLGKLISASLAVSLARRQAAASRLFATVGDVTTLLFHSAGLQPSLSVVDLRVKRRPLSQAGVRQLRAAKAAKLYVSNSAGSISAAAVRKINSAPAFSSRKAANAVLFVSGEEDLLFLPVALAAPAGSLVFYGQPGKGVVVFRASASAKKRLAALVAKAFQRN